MVVTFAVVAMVLTVAGLCAVTFLLRPAETLRDNAAQTVLPGVVRAGLEPSLGREAALSAPDPIDAGVMALLG